MAIAFHGSNAGQARTRRQRRGNPFSQGIVTNCKDFWCDGAPVFAKKEGGFAKLGGERVDYTRLYDVEAIPKLRSASGGGGERYESVGTEEEV